MQIDPIHSSLEALRRSFFLVLGISIIVSVLGYGIAKNIPGVYEVHFSYMVSMDQKDVAPGFRYDGYYALSAADLFSQTLASIADSPETIVSAYKEANISLPTQDAIRLTRIVRSEKAAPQLVRLTVRDASKEKAEKVAVGLQAVIDKAIEQYNTKGLSSIVFHGVATEMFTARSEAAPFPIAASLFMLVFVGGNMIVLFQEALKRGAT